MHSLNIIAETAHWIAISKEAGIVVEQLYDYDSVEGRVRQYLQAGSKREPFVGIVHRLDRPVSGLVLLAKKPGVLKQLNAQFANRQVAKTYWAVVSPKPLVKTDTLAHFMVKDTVLRKAIVFETPKKGAVPAQLTYRTLAEREGQALLEVELHTGRYHQIRAQLAAVGCPIVGDEKYGGLTSLTPNTIALHARQLAFDDHLTGARMVLTAPPPQHYLWDSFATQ